MQIGPFRDVAVTACGLPSACGAPLYAAALRHAGVAVGANGEAEDGGADAGLTLSQFGRFWKTLPSVSVNRACLCACACVRATHVCVYAYTQQCVPQPAPTFALQHQPRYL